MEFRETIFISIDIETTGMSSTSAKILEIGAVKFYPFGETVDTYSQLIHPGIEIPFEVTLIHNITDGMVKNSPEIKDVYPVFLEFIQDYPIICHNAGFDFAFLSLNAKELGFTFKSNSIFDTLILSKKAFPYKKHNLDELKNLLGLKAEGERHRALTDAMLAMQLFEACLDSLRLNTYEELVEMFPPKFPLFFLPKKKKISWYKRQIEFAIKNRKNVEIEYMNVSGEVTKRMIIPISLGLNGFIEAECKLRNDNRKFLISRILNLKLLD